MVEISEKNRGQMSGPLAAGIGVVSEQQTVNFVLYNRRVLPADGFVFWVNSGVTNAGNVPTSFNAKGSLHHTTTNTQDPDESTSIHRMVFTAMQRIDQLSAITPDTLWMGITESGERYAFSSRSSFYVQSGLYHYSGDAAFPVFDTQIVDGVEDLDLTHQVVSNSLPLWLTLNRYFPLYPSLLVPDNLVPPYAAVSIGEDDTSPMTSGPTYDANNSRFQLAKDSVRITFYGVRNDVVMDWLDYVQDYVNANPSVIGVMNTPIPRDAKRGQVEISTLAQKKVVQFEVNYYQSRIRAVSRQFILNALIKSFLVHTL